MHIFITGAKRIGKSTLLNAILSAYSGRVGGFRTVRCNTFLPGQYTVHLFHPDEAQEPTQENLLFVCGRKATDTAQRFEQLGCQVLRQSIDADLLLMDELGPNEAEAEGFQRTVWAAVEGNTPILGVLQKADSPLLEKIARHPNVHLLEVTEDNRDDLSQRLPKWINILTKR